MKEACLIRPGSDGMFEWTVKLKMIPGFLRPITETPLEEKRPS